MRVIYFDLDCVRPDHLGCYGYNRPTSPNIDRMAAEGVRFTNYYCTSSPCLPSRSGLYSGRYGIRSGTLSNHGAGAEFHIEKELYCGPKPENEIFPRQLRRHGLDTYCFSTFADRHNVWWWSAGWTEFHTPNLKGGLDTGAEINEKVLPWLENNARRDNYFLHINYWDAHRVYSKDPSWAEPLKDYPVAQEWPDEATIARHQSVTGLFTAATQPYGDHVKKDKKDFNKSPHPLMADTVSCRADFELMVTGYDAMIRYVDDHIGQVLELLEKQDVLKDTVIIVSADHGDSFGEHAVYTDHVNADNCIHNIPLIIRWPGVTRQGGVDEHFMANVDFAPTLCDMLGVPAVEQWDGKSYRNNLEGGALPEDRDFIVWDTALYTVQRAVRTKQYLYMRTYDSSDYNNWEDEELYDMTKDRYQTENIAGQKPEVIAECRRLMADWVAEQRAKPGFVSDPLAEVLKERGKPVPAELL
ncbi:sulfatase family protein [Tichowtungia aerotolerans]|uniref:Sulfatase-like hydrolase/transferase n=1 Tax=Tichowtungia aerotolerans TaxID=2697043 RepID=A0A6P1M8L3_9BACT|nr:sulfatase [Tichowtungia aerotolerans]QHI69403.1 sulfatase-like hydrolase/transferase [Tichowtungia aerotolerans]